VRDQFGRKEWERFRPRTIRCTTEPKQGEESLAEDEGREHPFALALFKSAPTRGFDHFPNPRTGKQTE
jgi:hypothetical protein